MKKPIVTAALLAGSAAAVLLVWYAVSPGSPPWNAARPGASPHNAASPDPPPRNSASPWNSTSPYPPPRNAARPGASPWNSTSPGTSPATRNLPLQEPAAYAYRCDNAKGEGPHEECAPWFVVTRSGRTWQLDDAAEGTPVDLSADGRYLAYARATDQRGVVRDLAAGTVLPIQESVRADDLEGRELVPTLLSDGHHLLVTVRATNSAGDETPLPPAFIVNLADGRTLWHLPQDGTLARLDQDGTRLIVTDDRALSTLDSSGTTKVPIPARLRTPAALGTLIPDGAAQAAQIVSRNPAAGGSDIRPSRLVTIDTHDGKVLHDVRLRLPLRNRASFCDTTQWVNASEVLLRCATGKLFEEIAFRVDTRTGTYAKVTELHPPRPHLFELVRAEN